MEKDTEMKLVKEALKARQNAYCPYSGYKVGAALLTRSGHIYIGCNVENAAFTPGSCAERTAINSAVAAGERDFVSLAIAGGYDEKDTGRSYPCGVCRQVIREFADDDFPVIIASLNGSYELHSISELLPYSFGASQVNFSE